MVLTSSYGASGWIGSAAWNDMPPRSPWVSVFTPMLSSSLRMVATSCKRGTLSRRTGSSVSSAAHISGSAAFLAPEMMTSPFRARPPVIRNLSMGLISLFLVRR